MAAISVVVIGVVTSVVMSQIMAQLPDDSQSISLSTLYLVPTLTMAAIGVVLTPATRRFRRWQVAIPALIALGIAFGVTANAFIDESLGRSHDLFPFEITFQWALFIPGLLLGLAVGHVLRKR